MPKIPGISFTGTNRMPILDNDYGVGFEIPFYKDNEYFAPYDNFVRYVKAVEKMVRGSKEYKQYKGKLHELGLNVCQIHPNIEPPEETNSMTEIEMHHGPILTLFDVISIMTDSELYHGRVLSTFGMTTKVIQEHYENNVQVVMLSKTAHEEVHENNIFLNMKQGFGNINRFIRKYGYGISREQRDKINEYIETSLRYDSTDNGILELRDTGMELRYT